MAMATLPASKVPWAELIADYDRIRDAIEGVFPDFKDYNQRIRHPGGFRLPLPPTERIWTTPSGKAEFLLFNGLEEDPAVTDKTSSSSPPSAATTSTTPRSMGWTTAIAACSAGATCCS